MKPTSKATDFGLLILRVFLFAIVAYYGAQRVLGLFGGHGLHATVDQYQKQFAFPEPVSMALVIAELAGACSLLIGLLGRLGALAVAVTWGLAAYTMLMPRVANFPAAHLQLAIVGMALTLVFTGTGQFSIEGAFVKKRRRRAHLVKSISA